MLVDKVEGFYVVYKGKIFVTPKGKFTWQTTGQARNAVNCHWYTFAEEVGRGYDYRWFSSKEGKDWWKEVKKEIKVMPVNLDVEV